MGSSDQAEVKQSGRWEWLEILYSLFNVFLTMVNMTYSFSYFLLDLNSPGLKITLGSLYLLRVILIFFTQWLIMRAYKEELKFTLEIIGANPLSKTLEEMTDGI